MKKAALVLMAIALSIFALTVPRATAQETKVKIVPSTLEVGPPPANFLVNVTVEDVELMVGFEIYITFNATVLQCNNITLPPDFVYAGLGYLETEKKIDNNAGTVHYGVATFPFYDFNGSGVLCQLNFTAIALDGVSIKIVTPNMGQDFYTQLLTRSAQEIPYTAEDGFVTVIPEFSTVLMLLGLLTFTTTVAVRSKIKLVKP